MIINVQLVRSSANYWDPLAGFWVTDSKEGTNNKKKKKTWRNSVHLNNVRDSTETMHQEVCKATYTLQAWCVLFSHQQQLHRLPGYCWCAHRSSKEHSIVNRRASVNVIVGLSPTPGGWHLSPFTICHCLFWGFYVHYATNFD